MDGRPPRAAFLFAAFVGLVALAESILSGTVGRQELVVLAFGAVPVIAFAIIGLAPRRRTGMSA